jgi:hypothetical protein
MGVSEGKKQIAFKLTYLDFDRTNFADELS